MTVTTPRRRIVAVVAMLLAATLALGACTASTTAGRPKSTAPRGTATPSLSPAVASVQADLLAALRATSWPTLNPTFQQTPVKDNRRCAGDVIKAASICTWGNAAAPHTLYLVGDSTSAAYLPSFVTFIDQIPSWKMVMRSDAGCPFSTTPAPEGNGLDPDAGSAACAAHNEKVVAEIESVHPDLVIFTTVSGAAARIPGKQAELKRIQSASGRIVVFPTSPAIKDPQQCAKIGSTPQDCITPMPSAYHLWLRNLQAVASAVDGVFIDPTKLFCADDACPAFVKTIPRTDDGVHMTPAYATYLGPAVHELFQGDHLLP